MASINYAARQISVKIVYYGPGLSGKTTNLQVIHKKTPQEHKSDMVSLATETDRTLFFDFLPLDLGKIKGFATKFQLYTVPGQVYYNATRKLVLRGVDGVVFVADSGADKVQENLESFQNLEDNLAEYGYQRESIPIIIQYNKRDLPNALPIEELQRLINKYNLPYNEGVAYKGVGVFDTLKQIGKIVIDYLNKKYSRSSPGGRSAAPAPAAPAAPQYQQPMAAPSYAAPAPQYTPPQAPQYAPPPQAPQYAPPQAPQYQPPTGAFAPPPAQGYGQQQAFDPFAGAPSFEPPQAPHYTPPPQYAPPPQAPQYQPPTGGFAPPPAQGYGQQQAFDPFAGAPSFEPPAAPAQQYQQFGGANQYAPPQAPQYQAPPMPTPSYDTPSFDMAPPPTPSFDMSTPSFDMAPPAQSFDPYAQHQASPWGDPAAASADPFLAAPSAHSAAPSFEMQSHAPAPQSNSMDYDDIFMVDPGAQQPPPAVPPTQSMPAAGGQGGGYDQSPFEFEMAPPPPPMGNAHLSGMGGTGEIAQNDFEMEGFGGAPTAAPPPPPQADFSFDYQPFSPQQPAGGGFGEAPAAPQWGAPPAQPAAAYQPAEAAPPGGRSELDLEIEKYQREIEEKQKKMRSAGPPAGPSAGLSGFQGPARPDTHEMQPYAGPGDNHYQAPAPFQPAAAPSFQPLGEEPKGANPFSDFEAELEGSAARGHGFNYGDECPTDSAMFFTSVDKRGNSKIKKPVKPPVNPAKVKMAQQQQKSGFLPKLFNKNQ